MGTSHRFRACISIAIASLATLLAADTGRADTSAIHVHEFSAACGLNATPSVAFVELSADGPGQTFDANIGVAAYDSLGRVMFDTPNIFASRLGQSFTQGATFLLGTSAFATVTGAATDGTISGTPDKIAGRIVLYRVNPATGVRTELDRASYGTAHKPFAPPPGRSLQRQSDGSLFETPYPDPTNFAGVLAVSSCYQVELRSQIVVDEVNLLCHDGGTQGQFIELTNKANGTYFDSDFGLRVYDHNGALLGEIPQLFRANAGDYWPIGRRWLLGNPQFASVSNTPADDVFPFTLDPLGGRFDLITGPSGLQSPLSSVAYGGGHSVLPAPGGSLQRTGAFDAYTTKVKPDPTTSNGTLCTVFPCLGADTRAFFVDELLLQCTDGGTAGQFVALTHANGTYSFANDVGLRAFDHSGVLLFDLPGVFGQMSGTSWPSGKKFLLARPSLQTLTGVAPDAVLPAELDPLGGRVEIYLVAAGGPVVNWRVSYGAGGTNALPPVGSSLGLQGANYVVQVNPTPVTFAGLSMSAAQCHATPPLLLRVNEFALQCANHGTAGQFVELQADTASTLTSRLGVRYFARDGSRIATVPNVLAGLAGGGFAAGTNFLLALPGFGPLTTSGANGILPVPLDTLSGRFEVFLAWGSDTTIMDAVAYGPGAIERPVPGASMERIARGSFQMQLEPSPRVVSGTVLTVPDCLGNPDPKIALNEVSVACRDSSLNAQFVKLTTLQRTALAGNVGLTYLDHAGAVLADIRPAFASSSGSQVPAGSTFLLTTSDRESASGVHADGILPTRLDALGGTLQVYSVGPTGVRHTWSQASYGDGLNLSNPGGSFVIDPRYPFAVFTRNAFPSPTNLEGTSAFDFACDDVASRRIHVGEVALACLDGSPIGQFIELSGDDGAQFSPNVGLRWYDASGRLTGNLPGLLAPWAQSSWTTGRTVLIAPAAMSSLGISVDVVMPAPMDTTRGRIELYLTSAGREFILETFEYGTSSLPRPPRGASLQRNTSGAFTVQLLPTPTNQNGESPNMAGCLGPSAIPVHLDEFGLACQDHQFSGQFIELQADGDTRFLGDVTLRWFDHTGSSLGYLTKPFGAATGSAWPARSRWLLANPGFPAAVGGAPDALLPVPLDTLGGRIELYSAFLGDTVWSVTYGGVLPVPGGSLQRTSTSTWVAAYPPTPTNFAGVLSQDPGCHLTRPTTRIYFAEVALQCIDGGRAGQFLRLAIDGPPVFDQSVYLRARNNQGVVVGTLSRPFGSYTGQRWSPGHSWLIVGPDEPAPQLQLADAQFPCRLPLDGGVVELCRGDSTAPEILDWFVYYPAYSYYQNEMPFPIAGESELRSAYGWSRNTEPTPTNYAGNSLALPSCHFTSSDRHVFISELFVHCTGSSGPPSFIELGSSESPALFSPSTGLRGFDHAGRPLFDVLGPFGRYLNYPWPTNGHWLLSSASASVPSGIAPDFSAPIALDSLGGLVQVYRLVANGEGVVVDSLRYGPGGVPAPAPGMSLQRTGTLSEWTEAVPTPTGYLATGFSGAQCPTGCPSSLLEFPYGFGFPRSSITSPQLDAGSPYGSYAHAVFDGVAGSFDVLGSARLDIRDQFVVEGAPPGTPVTLRARLDGAAYYFHYFDCRLETYCHGSSTQGSVLMTNGIDTVRFTPTLGLHSYFISVPVQAIAGVPFPLEILATAFSTFDGSPRTGGSGQVSGKLQFTDYPPGLTIRSCKGFVQDVPTPVPTLIENASADAAPDHVSLRWIVRDAASFAARVERSRTGDPEWTRIGDVSANSDGQVRFDDAHVDAGAHYDYRLAWTDPRDGAVTAGGIHVDVPEAFRFALFGARPNPTHGPLAVAFQLPREGEAAFELLDIAGRRVYERREKLAAGNHVLAVPGNSVRPGFYLLRLRFNGQSATSRAIVTR